MQVILVFAEEELFFFLFFLANDLTTPMSFPNEYKSQLRLGQSSTHTFASVFFTLHQTSSLFLHTASVPV